MLEIQYSPPHFLISQTTCSAHSFRWVAHFDDMKCWWPPFGFGAPFFYFFRMDSQAAFKMSEFGENVQQNVPEVL